MSDNRAELILALRDEISSGMAKVNAAVGQSREGIANLGGEARNASAQFAVCQTAAQDFGNVVKRALEFAGITIGLAALASKVKEFYGEVMAEGARTEMLKGSAYAIGQYYQVSGQAIDYYAEKLQNTGITEQNAFYGVTKFLAGGLNLELIPALAAAAKNLAPLAPEGKTVNEEFKGLVTTISSGMPRGLKEFGVQMGNVLGDAGRSLKQLDDEMSMTSVERAQATLTYVLNYSEKVKYVGEETAGAYARQQAKLQVEAKRAKEALFDVFRPIGEAVTGQKIKAWEDLNGAIVRNKDDLVSSANAIGVYVGRITSAVGTVLVFAGTHKELFTGLLELATIYKVAAWITPYITGTTAAATARATLAAAETTAAAATTLAATAQTAAGGAAATATPLILYEANAYGVVTKETILAAPALASAGTAAATSGTMAASAMAGWTGLAGSIKLAVIALATYGAIKTFKEPGQLTGPESSGDPFADVVAGSNRTGVADLTGGHGPLTIPDKTQQYLELETKERIAQANKAVEKALSDAKGNQPPSGGKGGGGEGGGLDAAQGRLENFIQNLRQQAAQAAGDSIKAVEAWKTKEFAALGQIEAKTGESEEARTALKAAYASKRGKIEEDFNLLVAKESGNTYVEIEAQAQKWLNTYQGIAGAEAAIAEITARKKWEADVKNYTERLTLDKSFYDQAAQLTPVISEQIDLKRKSLDLEIKLGDAALATKLAQLQTARQITAADADQYRAAQALLDQQKRLNFEMENNRGLGGWAYARAKGEDQFTVRGALEGAESFLDNALTQAIQGALSKTKTDWMEVGKTTAQSMVLNFGKSALHQGITEIAKASLPKDSTSGISGVLGNILGANKPDGSPAKPFYVISAAPGKNIAGLFGGGGAGSGGQEANEVTRMWNSISGRFEGVFDQGSSELNISSTLWNSMFQGSNAGLLGISTDFSGMFDTSITGLLGSSESFGGVFSGFLSGISGLFGGGAGGGGGDILSTVMGIGSSLLGFVLHGGGVVAHSGWLVAHEGLNLDERRIIAQVGEGVIKAPTMAAYARAGISFDDLNEGRLPVLPVPGNFTTPGRQYPAGSTVTHDNRQVHISVQVGDIHAYDMTPQEAEKFVDRKIIPAFEKKLGNRARSLAD